MGFFKKALEISGATDVVLCFTVPIDEGKGIFRALDFLELNDARRDPMFASFFVSRVDSKDVRLPDLLPTDHVVVMLSMREA